MADNEKMVYDEEKFYDEQLIPLIDALIAKCEERKLPMVVHVNYSEAKDSARCGTSHHIPDPNTPVGRTLWLASQILRRQKLDMADMVFLMANAAYTETEEDAEHNGTEDIKEDK